MSNETRDNLNLDYRHGVADVGACPSPSRLARLAANRAWPWQRRSLADHLGRCHQCADEYQVLLRVRPGLEQALNRHAPAKPTSRPRWGLALASVVAVAAVALALLPVQQEGVSPTEGGLAQEQAVESAIFGAEFESLELAATESAPDQLFSGDFDRGPSPELFTDEFGG